MACIIDSNSDACISIVLAQYNDRTLHALPAAHELQQGLLPGLPCSRPETVCPSYRRETLSSASVVLAAFPAT